MFLVGLTGGIASGKSTVTNHLRKLGVVVLDADEIARRVVEPGKKAWKKIKKEFPDVIKDSGEIDRGKLGEIIFSDASKRRLLDKITHREIYKEMFWEILAYFFKGKHFVVLDLPLLFESGVVVDYVYKIIVIRCEEEQQIQRLFERNKYSREDALKRIKSQMPLEEKCKLANFIINNDSSVESTKDQVEATLKVLNQSKYYWRLRILIVLWSSMILIVILWITNYFSQ